MKAETKTVEVIHKHIDELSRIADGLRNRSTDANAAAMLAAKALATARDWLVEAAEATRRDPFEAAEDDTA
jgi:hypothetical protein